MLNHFGEHEDARLDFPPFRAEELRVKTLLRRFEIDSARPAHSVSFGESRILRNQPRVRVDPPKQGTAGVAAEPGEGPGSAHPAFSVYPGLPAGSLPYEFRSPIVPSWL